MSTPVSHGPAHRSAALDGLRGVAALSVFVFHAWLYTRVDVRAMGATGTLDKAVSELRIGLVLFFVLSGFLLFRPWVAARLGTDRSAPRIATYAAHRVARIVPAYYLTIIGSALVLWPLAGEPGVRLPPVEQLPLFLVFAQNQSAQTVMTLDPPMWTLAVEASFYLVLPALGWVALRARATRAHQSLVPLGLLACGLAYNVLLAQLAPAQTLSKSLPAMAPYFAVGMLAAVLVHGRTPRRRAATLLAGAAVTLVIADGLLHAGVFSGTALELNTRLVRDLPAAIGFAAIVALAAALAPRALGWRPLAWTGMVSYGFYLWHVPVLLVLRGNGLLPLSTVGATVVALPIALTLGWLSFRFIESPAIAWSRRTRRLGANRERVRPAEPQTARRAHVHTPSTATVSR